MIKRFIAFIRSDKISYRPKVYYLIMICGILSTFIGAASAIPLHQPLSQAAPFLVIAFLLIGAVIYTHKTGNYAMGVNIAIFLLNTILLPYSFITNEGVKGGTSVWFLLGVVFVAIQVEDAISRIILWVITFFSFSACCVFNYVHPDKVIRLADDRALVLDNYLALVVVGSILSAIIVATLAMYKKESETSRKQKEEIERLNRSQNAFFSSMSHEIRTPINTIIGLNEMILREEGASEEISENAANIQNASRMLLGLINDILDISKIESGKMEILPAQYETRDLFADVVGMIYPLAMEKGLAFHLQLSDQIPCVLYGDSMRIKQVLINVLTNAVKYTKEGSVTFSVETSQVDNNHCNLVFSVSDTGMGIRRESIPYLFDAFQRVDEKNNRAIEGTGLGLSICKQLVSLMEGTITVDSIYTKGSTFRIELTQRILDDYPMEVGSVWNPERRVGNYHQSFEAPGASILVVDDNEMNRKIVGKLLRNTRIKVEEAASGREALELTAKHYYDLILMDHLMPEMDGVETSVRIRSQQGGLCSESPVIALTANAGSGMQEFYMGSGFAGYLAKPFSGEQLEATVASFISEEKMVYHDSAVSVNLPRGVSETVRKRRPILITMDGAGDIPPKLTEYGDVKKIPFFVQTSEGLFRDGDEIDSRALVSHIENRNGRAISQEPSVAMYESFFGEALTEAVEVIHLSLSAGISNACTRATEAAESFSNVHVVNTWQVSGGLGLMATEATRMVKEGCSCEQIIDRLMEMRGLVNSSFVVSKPQHLLENGRLPIRIPNFVRSIGLYPIIRMRYGRFVFGGIVSGNALTAGIKYVRNTFRDRSIDYRQLIVVTAACKSPDREEIAQRFKMGVAKEFEMFDCVETSSVVTANCGPDTFGCFYVRKKRN